MQAKLLIIIETAIITVLLVAIVIYGQVVWQQYHEAQEAAELAEQAAHDAEVVEEGGSEVFSLPIEERVKQLEELNTVSEEEMSRAEREALLEQLTSTE